MKKVISALLFTILIHTGFAQMPANNTNQDDRKVYVNPEMLASFPGGEPAWQRFVAANLDTTLPVKNGAPAGTYTVNVRFIVEMDGGVTNVVCESAPYYGLCQEAIRLVKKSGKWKPGTQNGRIVNSFKSEPIVFTVK
jgi:protein TonB